MVAHLGIFAADVSCSVPSSIVVGRSPTPRQLKSGKIVGYIALAFGCLFLLELAFTIIR
jgi:hypothetical protein